jgi:uncharacterized protein (TIGR03084 family)
MSSDVDAVIADLAGEQQAVTELVTRSDLARPTAAAGRSVGDTVGHLFHSDQAAIVALRDPERFRRQRADPARRAQADLPLDSLLAAWRDAQGDLIDALQAADPAARVDWFGPSMSLRSFASARIMEYWAHGEDIADAVRRALVTTNRLRNVCHLGVATRAFSFTVHGEAVPAVPVSVTLEAPEGGTWVWGDPLAVESITGTARDFCLVVTQRRALQRTRLVVHGPGALAWMDLAQAFAGAPTTTSDSRG